MKTLPDMLTDETEQPPNFTNYVEVLLLILFFTLTADFGSARHVIPDDRPSIDRPGPPVQPTPHDVTVIVQAEQTGRVYDIDGKRMTLAELRTELTTLKTRHGDVAVFADGSWSAPNGAFVQLQDLADAAGIRYYRVVDESRQQSP